MPIYVPTDCTLHEAIRRSNQCNTQTIILLEPGEYDIKAHCSLVCIQKYLIITKPVCILGNCSIFNGGLFILDKIEGEIYIENVSICHKQGSGIIAESSFTVNNVCIRACQDDGILIRGNSVKCKCTNVRIRNCLESGLTLEGSSTVYIDGLNTFIKYNTCGISVCHSTISVVNVQHPLTKETISNHNFYNFKVFGCANLTQIKNV